MRTRARFSRGALEAPPACCSPISASRMSPEDAERAAELFRSLADPSRVRLVNLLATSAAPVCVCDLTDAVGLSQGTVSFHLRKLMDAGLLEREQRGTWAYYSLRSGALAQVAEILDPRGGRR